MGSLVKKGVFICLYRWIPVVSLYEIITAESTAFLVRMVPVLVPPPQVAAIFGPLVFLNLPVDDCLLFVKVNVSHKQLGHLVLSISHIGTLKSPTI